MLDRPSIATDQICSESGYRGSHLSEPQARTKDDFPDRARLVRADGSGIVENGARQFQNQPDTGTDRPAYQATPRTVLTRPDFETSPMANRLPAPPNGDDPRTESAVISTL